VIAEPVLATRRIGSIVAALLLLAAGCTSSENGTTASCAPRYALRYSSNAQLRAGAIALFDVDGHETRPGGDWITGEPSFAPDGRSLAVTWFESTDEGRDTAIAILGVGAKSRRIISGTEHGEFPAWSPDGSTIAYASNDYQLGGTRLRVMDADGSNNRMLTDNGDVTSATLSPAWSPDGKRIAFVGTNFFGSTAAWIVDRDGRHRRKLAPVASDADLVSWRPDGKKLLVSGAIGEPAIVDPATGKKTDVDRNAPAAIWSGGGNQVLFFGPRGEHGKYPLTRGTVEGTRLRPGAEVPNLPAQDVFPQGEGFAAWCT
jgi:dipeptidyl aminopeptidase/acylaminoacyl peptidase